jgi:hypothetical protein
MYGFKNSEEVSQNGSTGGKFGLNQGALVTKFEFNPNGGKENTEQECIDLTIQVKDKEYRQRFFPFTKAFDNGVEVTDPNNEKFKAGLDLYLATLSDIVLCFTTEENLKLALSQPIADFKSYAQTLEKLVKTNAQWDKTKVDVFLAYSWTIKGSNDKTYLELPKDVKHGSYVVRAEVGEFKLVEGDSIKYANESGVTHPIKRSQWFRESAFSNQQVTQNSSSAMENNPAEAGTADW